MTPRVPPWGPLFHNVVTLAKSDALKGCRDNLARAREDLDRLHQDITAYVDSQPIEIVDSVKGDETGIAYFLGHFRFKARPFGQPDPFIRWGQDVLNIGVGIYGALNYLVNELSMKDQAGGLKADDKGAVTSFPICLSEKDFLRREDELLRGVNSEHRAMIKLLQPYQRGTFEAAKDDPLAVLKSITNPPKHRFPNAVLLSDMVVTKNHLKVSWDTPGPPPQMHLQAPERYFVVKDGAEAYRLTVVSDRPMKVDCRRVETTISGEVAFGPRRITTPRIERVHNRVVEIIDRFEPVFEE